MRSTGAASSGSGPASTSTSAAPDHVTARFRTPSLPPSLPSFPLTHPLALALAFTLALPGAGALAQQAPASTSAATAGTDGAPAVLEAITVLGSGVRTPLLETPAAVTLIGPPEIREKSHETPAELLRDIPGVQLVDGDVAGSRRISIRGEESRRVLIMIDGQPLTDHSNQGTPVLVDPDTIERIEVVRGPSSVLYGSRAIGGVVNIVTKGGGSKPFQGDASLGYYSATNGYRASASIRGAVDASDYRISVGKSVHGERRTPDGKLENSGYRDDSVSVHLGHGAGPHYVSLKAEQYRLQAGSWVEPGALAGYDTFSVDLPQRDLRRVGLQYQGDELRGWLKGLQANVYYQSIDRVFENRFTRPAARGSTLSFFNQSDDRQLTWGGAIKLELALAERHRTLAGIDFEHDSLDSDKSTSISFPRPTTTSSFDEAAIRTASLYAQDEWKFTDTLTGYLGARYYDVSANLDASSVSPIAERNDARWLGTTGLVWSPTRTFSLRGSVAQGYTWPTLSQLFVTSTAGGNTTVGNPALAPESGTTFEIGARWTRRKWLVDTTFFVTRAKDYIARQTVNPASGATPGLITWVNVERARTTGFEALVEYETDSRLKPYVSGAVIRREYDYGAYTTFDSGTPIVFGRVGVRSPWQSGAYKGVIDAYLRGARSSVRRDATGAVDDRGDAYTTLNLAATADLGNAVTVRLGLNNLLDRDYRPIDELPAPGRSLELTLSLRF